MSMSDQHSEKSVVKTGSYQAPKLTVFGKVLDLTNGPNSGGTESANTKRPSDPRVKEHIVRVGTHDHGYGLYLFDYLPEFQPEFGAGRQFGVMADEVRAIRPDAVSVADDGYLRVDYAALGIKQLH